jgi:hypothetical protein
MIRGRRKPSDVQKVPFTERIGEQINRFPKIYTIGRLIALAVIYPLLANRYMIDVAITCLIYYLKSLPALYYLIIVIAIFIIIGVRRLDNSRIGRAYASERMMGLKKTEFKAHIFALISLF